VCILCYVYLYISEAASACYPAHALGRVRLYKVVAGVVSMCRRKRAPRFRASSLWVWIGFADRSSPVPRPAPIISPRFWEFLRDHEQVAALQMCTASHGKLKFRCRVASFLGCWAYVKAISTAGERRALGCNPRLLGPVVIKDLEPSIQERDNVEGIKRREAYVGRVRKHWLVA
jgi:hypothetical protein